VSASTPRFSRASLDSAHAAEFQQIENSQDDVVVFSKDYPPGYQVPQHFHRRTQFLCAFSGVILVETTRGRFVTPPGYALLIPPRFPHAVSMLTDVKTYSVYMTLKDRSAIRDHPIVVGITDLARSLILAAVSASDPPGSDRKTQLMKRLLVEEILALRERPLALPFPSDRKLSALCRDFLSRPSPSARIDDWAVEMGMSRRTFTRFFRREMNVSFVAWRQQASVLSSLRRLAEGEAVTVVAMEAGYQNTASFTTMFSRVLGMTPRDYVASSRAFPTGR